MHAPMLPVRVTSLLLVCAALRGSLLMRLGLILGKEAPSMMPDSIDILSFTADVGPHKHRCVCVQCHAVVLDHY